jgi:hypothetical protein
MYVSVLPLRRHGQLLTNRELSEIVPTVGSLIIGDWPPHTERGRHSRWSRRAQIAVPSHSGTPHYPLTPIFDPQIVWCDESGMYLSGTELEPRGDAVFEHVQVWRCLVAQTRVPALLGADHVNAT